MFVRLDSVGNAVNILALWTLLGPFIFFLRSCPESAFIFVLIKCGSVARGRRTKKTNMGGKRGKKKWKGEKGRRAG